MEKTLQTLFSEIFLIRRLVSPSLKTARFSINAKVHVLWYLVRETENQLSKWWQTPSARAAFKRVEAARKVRAKRVRKYFAARKAAHAAKIAALDREIWEGGETE